MTHSIHEPFGVDSIARFIFQNGGSQQVSRESLCVLNDHFTMITISFLKINEVFQITDIL